MDDQLKKIELDTTPTPEVSQKKRFQWKFVLIPIGILVGCVVLVGILLLPLRGVLAQARVVAARGSELSGAVKNQDLVGAKEGLAQTRKELTTLANEYKRVLPLKFIPVLGWYIGDGEHAINAAIAGVTAGDK